MSALNDLRSMHQKQGQVDWRVIGPFFWMWYHDHANDTIIKRKILIISVNIRVRDLYSLFVQLFGPEPEHTAYTEA